MGPRISPVRVESAKAAVSRSVARLPLAKKPSSPDMLVASGAGGRLAAATRVRNRAARSVALIERKVLARLSAPRSRPAGAPVIELGVTPVSRLVARADSSIHGPGGPGGPGGGPSSA